MTTDCILWSGALNRYGYGVVRFKGRVVYVHRQAYAAKFGAIPVGKVIDHLCRVRNCTNPDHMEAVTIKENVLRGEGITAKQLRQTECKRGHKYNEVNTYLYKTKRICRICRCQNVKNYKLRLRANNASNLAGEPDVQ